MPFDILVVQKRLTMECPMTKSRELEISRLNLPDNSFLLEPEVVPA
jgi:hypothetical protein